MKTKIHTLRALAGAALIAAPFAVPITNTYAEETPSVPLPGCVAPVASVDKSLVKVGASTDTLNFANQSLGYTNYIKRIEDDGVERKVNSSDPHYADYVELAKLISSKMRDAEVVKAYVERAMMDNSTCAAEVAAANGAYSIRVLPVNNYLNPQSWNDADFVEGWQSKLSTDGNYSVALMQGNTVAHNYANIYVGGISVDGADSATYTSFYNGVMNTNFGVYSPEATRLSLLNAHTVKMTDFSLYKDPNFGAYMAAYPKVKLASTVDAVNHSVVTGNVKTINVKERNVFVNGVYYGALGTKSNGTFNYKGLKVYPVFIAGSKVSSADDQAALIKSLSAKYSIAGVSNIDVTAWTSGTITGDDGSSMVVTAPTLSSTDQAEITKGIKADYGATSVKFSGAYKITYTYNGASKSVNAWVATVDDMASLRYAIEEGNTSDYKSLANGDVAIYSLGTIGTAIETTDVTYNDDIEAKIPSGLIKAYDIKVKNGAQEVSSFADGILVRVKVPTANANKVLKARHIAEDGKMTDINATYVQVGSNGYAEFTTNHLSVYAIVATGTKPATGDTNNNGDDKNNNDDKKDETPSAPASGALGMILKGGASIIAIAAGIAALIALPFAVKRFYHKKLTMKH